MGNSIAKAMSLEDKLHTMILGTGGWTVLGTFWDKTESTTSLSSVDR